MANFGGQLCTKPGVVFVPYGEAGDAFADDVAKRLEGTEPTVLLNERLRDALRDAVGRLEQRGRAARRRARPTARASGISRAPTRPTPATSARPRSCSRSTSGRSCCSSATGRATTCSRRWTRRGQLTGTLHAQDGEDVAAIVEALRARAGRVIFDGFPTGVAVTHGMHHGGPFPATSAPAHTSVGMTAIARWLRPVAYQNAPRGAAPAGAARGQPARDLAPRGRRADRAGPSPPPSRRSGRRHRGV